MNLFDIFLVDQCYASDLLLNVFDFQGRREVRKTVKN